MRRSRRRRNPTIEMSDRYAVEGVKREYGTAWAVSWWREAIQNSVDAGATKIELSISDNGDETFTVRALDNGSGMSEHILVNKFFGYGETGKVGQDAVAGTGGFGVAKGLLLFPWLRWRVTTRDMIAEGKVRTWDFVAGDHPFLQGTLLEVVMSKDDIRSFTIANAVYVIENSYIPHVEFTVYDYNSPEPRIIAAELLGEKREESVENMGEFRFTHRKGGEESTIFVRHVNPNNNSRLFMFSKRMWMEDKIPGTLTFDILLPSLEAFSSSRNKLENASLERQIEQVATSLIKSVAAWTRKGQGHFMQTFIGDTLNRFKSEASFEEVRKQYGPQYTFDSEDFKAGIQDAAEEDKQRSKESEPSELPPSGQAKPQTAQSGTIDATAELLKSLKNQEGDISSVVQAAAQQLLWKPDYILFNEASGFEVPAEFWPQTMTKSVMRLLTIWAEFCRLGLILMGNTKKFGVGFCFSTDALGMFISDPKTRAEIPDFGGWILLNPIKAFKRDYYSAHIDLENMEFYDPNKTKDLDWMYSVVVHELTHMVDGISGHGDSFAYGLTHNMGMTGRGYTKLSGIARGVKLRGLPGLTRTELVRGGASDPSRPHAFRFPRGRRAKNATLTPCTICGKLQDEHLDIVIPKKKIRAPRRSAIPARSGFYRIRCDEPSGVKPVDYDTVNKAYKYMQTIDDKYSNFDCYIDTYYRDSEEQDHRMTNIDNVYLSSQLNDLPERKENTLAKANRYWRGDRWDLQGRADSQDYSSDMPPQPDEIFKRRRRRRNRRRRYR